MPRVSVIIPTHNRPDMLGEALDSVLAQTYRDFEIIVVDDGSTDSTREMVASYGDRVRYVYQESQGASRARNAAIRIANGAYVAFLDDDDVWYPRKLELQAAVLDSRSDVDLVYGSAYLVERGDRQLLCAELLEEGTLLERLISHTWWIPAVASVVMVRKKMLERSGLFDPLLWPCDDWEICTRIALHGGRFADVREVVTEYRMHRSNTVHDRSLCHAALIAALEKVFAAPETPSAFKAKRHYYLSREWVRIGNQRYNLELSGGALMAWLKAVELDPSVLTPQLLFLMGKSLFGPRMLGWARQARHALVGIRPSQL